MKKHILIVDDDKDVIRAATHLLMQEGYMTTSCLTAAEGWKKMQSSAIDLILLDVRLPDKGGIELCREIKTHPRTSLIPVIMISVKSDVSDVIVGLEMGADDYLRKPFDVAELLARVRTVLRRGAAPPADETIKIGPLTVDYARYEAFIDEELLPLTPKEFELLGYFARKEGRVLTRPAISENVWGAEYNPTSKTIEVHVDHLRKKLGERGTWIKILKGVGYRFEI